MDKIKEYITNNYDKETVQDIADHGCGGGVSGLIYYGETEKFHDEFEKEIWTELYEEAYNQGMTVMNLVERICHNAGSLIQVKNYLTWWAVELAAQSLIKEDK